MWLGLAVEVQPMAIEPPGQGGARFESLWGRNVNEAHFIPADQLFRGVQVLMVPKWGINNIPLIALYGGDIRSSFTAVRETEFWTVYSREGGDKGGSCPAAP